MLFRVLVTWLIRPATQFCRHHRGRGVKIDLSRSRWMASQSPWVFNNIRLKAPHFEVMATVLICPANAWIPKPLHSSPKPLLRKQDVPTRCLAWLTLPISKQGSIRFPPRCPQCPHRPPDRSRRDNKVCTGWSICLQTLVQPSGLGSSGQLQFWIAAHQPRTCQI